MNYHQMYLKKFLLQELNPLINSHFQTLPKSIFHYVPRIFWNKTTIMIKQFPISPSFRFQSVEKELKENWTEKSKKPSTSTIHLENWMNSTVNSSKKARAQYGKRWCHMFRKCEIKSCRLRHLCSDQQNSKNSVF